MRAHADAAAVAQVVELLLDNATRYASEDSVIELSLRAVSRGAGKGSAELVVSNAVDELPEGDLDRLFDRFYRADVSRSSKTGGSAWAYPWCVPSPKPMVGALLSAATATRSPSPSASKTCQNEPVPFWSVRNG